MIDNVTTALQTIAATGNGETLVLPEPRLVTFKIKGKASAYTSFRRLMMFLRDKSGF
jgi:hypothetical protein